MLYKKDFEKIALVEKIYEVDMNIFLLVTSYNLFSPTSPLHTYIHTMFSIVCDYGFAAGI